MAGNGGMRSSRGRSGQTAVMVEVVVVVVVEAGWAGCRMRSRHTVSQGECRQSVQRHSRAGVRGVDYWTGSLAFVWRVTYCSVMPS